MIAFFKKYKIFILVFFIMSAIILMLFYNALKPRKTLKIFNPADVNPEMVDTTVQFIKRDHTIDDFSFTNQNGKAVTQKDYEGKIYVADFFFTTCPSICVPMGENMAWLQNQIKNNPKVMLLSHSVMPDVDTPEVLKAYAAKKGVIDSKWNLVTGDKKDIYYIARKSYLAVKTTDSSELYDMVHTENFILVDQKRRIRGFYDGTKLEEVKKLLEDIKFLSGEE